MTQTHREWVFLTVISFPRPEMLIAEDAYSTTSCTWPAHLFCQRVALGWIRDLCSNTVSCSHRKLHVRRRWKRLMRTKENAWEATWLNQKRQGRRVQGSSVAHSREQRSRRLHRVARNVAPVAYTEKLSWHCVLKCLYTQVKWVEVSTVNHSGQSV